MKKRKTPNDRFCIYLIVDGCASDIVFEGTQAKCKKYVSQHAELFGNCIMTPTN